MVFDCEGNLKDTLNFVFSFKKALQGPLENGKEIRISYGNKGNEVPAKG